MFFLAIAFAFWADSPAQFNTDFTVVLMESNIKYKFIYGN